MTSTELIRPSRAPSPPEPWSDARHDAQPAASADPTVRVLLAAATVLVSLIGAILAAPYVLVRHLRGHWAGHASMRAAAAKFVPGESRWRAA